MNPREGSFNRAFPELMGPQMSEKVTALPTAENSHNAFPLQALRLRLSEFIGPSEGHILVVLGQVLEPHEMVDEC